jgi:hypothetical protein
MPDPTCRPTGRLALTAAKAALVAAIVVVGWTDAATTSGAAAPPALERQARDRDAVGLAEPAAVRAGSHLARLLEVHRCSVTGFGDGRTPRSAIVRSAAGRLRHVTFDAGWRVYTAHGPATLVAVCLDRPGAGRAA